MTIKGNVCGNLGKHTFINPFLKLSICRGLDQSLKESTLDIIKATILGGCIRHCLCIIAAIASPSVS